MCQRRKSIGSGLSAHLSRDFEQTFGQIVSRVRTLSHTNLVVSRHEKRGKKSHFRLTCVHEKRCCLKIRKNGQQKTCNIAAKRAE